MNIFMYQDVQACYFVLKYSVQWLLSCWKFPVGAYVWHNIRINFYPLLLEPEKYSHHYSFTCFCYRYVFIFDKHVISPKAWSQSWSCNMYWMIILTDEIGAWHPSSGCISVCNFCTSWIYSGLADDIMSSSL
jgi:hypothetical protein